MENRECGRNQNAAAAPKGCGPGAAAGKHELSIERIDEIAISRFCTGDGWGVTPDSWALMTQVLNKLTDQAHLVAAMASFQLVAPPGPRGAQQGLLHGPYSAEYGKD